MPRRHAFLLLASLTAAVGASGLAPSLAAAHGAKAAAAHSAAVSTKPSRSVSTAKATLYLSGAYFVHGDAVTVPGRAFSVTGAVRPYVPGQVVVVRSFVGRSQFRRDVLRVKPSRNGRVGLFTETVRSPRAGLVEVAVSHRRTAQMSGFAARRIVAALRPSAGFGARGLFVDLLQQLLGDVHVWVPATGVYDQHTGLAVDAYHRLLGWGHSQLIGPATVDALLAGRGRFLVRYPHDGKHVEGNLGKQLLALIYGSRVYRIYPISSGKPSTPTIIGHFRVYLRDPGYLPDGMYYSSFFSGGYAIHGFNPAPDYPASHGCMRVPIVDAISIYDWLNYGDVVDVYH